jgi:hypothetical protein
MNIKIVKQEIKLRSWGLKLWIVDIESWKHKHKHLDHEQKTSNRDCENQNHQPRSLNWYHEDQGHQPNLSN